MIIPPTLLLKVKRMAETYTPLIFASEGVVAMRFMETQEHLRSPPEPNADWKDARPGSVWGEAWGSAWFAGTVKIPPALDGRPVYLRAETDAIEAMLWVDGSPRGVFTHPTDAAPRGNHHTLLLAASGAAGDGLDIALEGYAGHPVVGTHPFEHWERQDHYPPRFQRVFKAVELMTRREEVKDFVFDLTTLGQMIDALPDDSFRRARICRVFEEIFAIVPQNPAHLSEESWQPLLAKARAVMRPALEARNSESAPRAGLIGHSHMDTAWTWPIDETIRKCARTYSNALSLMEQYPEYLFIQSSSYHTQMMQRHYPAIFEGIKRRVAEGRWEPNGGMWIECDCNLTSGEAMIRQFLKGQQYTRAHFDYRADTFWLPDTFGYSASLPQIMLGCGIRYFLTTKLSWNDTNTFPFDTFHWQGIDGSEVLTHFNATHCWPDPATLISHLHGGGEEDFRIAKRFVQHKDVNDRRMIAYGFGDGGGGPQYDMLELARRCEDLEGCPRAEHMTVSRFMQELEETSHNIPIHRGELYLEGHRGTLTSLHEIKRGNRKAELALREAEFLAVMTGREETQLLATLWDTLLVNQFHDILPGTSIPEVHDRATAELTHVIEQAVDLCGRLTEAREETSLTIWNSASWARTGTQALPGVEGGMEIAGAACQRIEDLTGETILLVSGLDLPPLSATRVELTTAAEPSAAFPFQYDETVLETPGWRVVFNESGSIESLVDLSCQREVRGKGLPLNTLLMGEDVPALWDNWDIDRDQKLKLRPQAELLHREVAANGPLQFRLRSEYRLGLNSKLRQDMVFMADSARIDFETVIEWNDPHQLLKVGFDVNVLAPSARHEIQFGHIERPTSRNNSFEQAMFEVANHKWTDLSENRYGVALLNDCKYGISVEGAEMRLTLIKGGCHPDPRGERGTHRMVYSLLPHAGGFSAEAVIRPAYELNLPLTVGGGESQESLFTVDAPNVICEAIKPAEDGRGFVVRLYEAERSSGRAQLKLRGPGQVFSTNMLEEVLTELPVRDGVVALDFRAFEILTLKIIPAA